MKGFHEKMCPKCHHPQMKTWEELSGEQKFLRKDCRRAQNFPLNKEKSTAFASDAFTKKSSLETKRLKAEV